MAAAWPTPEIAPEKLSDIWTLPLDLTDPDHPKPGKPELFLSTPAREFNPAFSPDGKWIAYQSGHEKLDIYVRPFPVRTSESGHTQVSPAGGQSPISSALSLSVSDCRRPRVWVLA